MDTVWAFGDSRARQPDSTPLKRTHHRQCALSRPLQFSHVSSICEKTKTMLVGILFALFFSAEALRCVQDGGTSDVVYNGDFTFGFANCPANLNTCASFTSMNIPDFLELDAGKDDSRFAEVARKNEGKIHGRCCMSQADVDKIQAKKMDKCDPEMETSCYCTTDECTGAAGGILSLASILAIALYTICDRS